MKTPTPPAILSPPPVRTKSDFVRRYQAGEFGNHAPTWGTLAEFADSGYRGLVHIRNRIAGAATWYNIPAEEVKYEWSKLIVSGWDAHNLYLSGMAPHDKNLIQGEVHRTIRGLDLYYALLMPGLPMRDALRQEPRQASGTTALMLLSYYMDNNSWEWIRYLLEAYPDHVIEFSTFGVEWGTLPRYNTVFWEVRLY